MPGINFSASKKKLLGEGAWVVSGQVTTTLAALVGIRLLTEIVPKEVYGTVSLLIGLMTLGRNLFTNPLNQAAQRFYPDAVLTETVPRLRRMITGTLKWTMAVLVCLTLLGGAVYCRFHAISYMVFLILAGLIVVEVMRNLEIGFLTAARRQKACAIWQALESWASPLFAVLIIVLLGATPQSILLGYFIASGGILLCFHLSPVKPEGLSGSNENFAPAPKLASDIRHFALPLIPTALVGWVNNVSDRYILGSLLGIGQVGIYAATYGLISRPFAMVGRVISQTLRPVHFSAVSSRNKTQEKKLFRIWLVAASLVSVFGAVAIFYLRNWIAVLLLAREYRSGALLMPWIAAGAVLQVVAQVYENVLLAYKRTRLVLLSKFTVAIVCVVSVFLLTRRFGLIGAASACPVYYFTLFLINGLLVNSLRKAEQ